jgi:antitoxin component of MazEF toxin-antitoxin module
MRQKIIRVGNSLGVVIPADFVKDVGIKPGETVIVERRPEDGKVIYNFSGVKQLAIQESLTDKVDEKE